MDEITAGEAWEELEAATNGDPTAIDVLGYLAEHADGWAGTFARMACLVAISKNW